MRAYLVGAVGLQHDRRTSRIYQQAVSNHAIVRRSALVLLTLRVPESQMTAQSGSDAVVPRPARVYLHP